MTGITEDEWVVCFYAIVCTVWFGVTVMLYGEVHRQIVGNDGVFDSRSVIEMYSHRQGTFYRSYRKKWQNYINLILGLVELLLGTEFGCKYLIIIRTGSKTINIQRRRNIIDTGCRIRNGDSLKSVMKDFTMFLYCTCYLHDPVSSCVRNYVCVSFSLRSSLHSVAVRKA